ncbi:formin-like protein 5 [Cricetulus griseus]|uniref:Formin-like protein 5 n=1 Tax=Cricetulus griseus TaxID=10029 RepID=A0A9J7GQ71_CRIGR|nr:formin-like protein 5 [Cricetulus griseus]
MAASERPAPRTLSPRGPAGSHTPQEGAVERAELGFCSRGDPTSSSRSACRAPFTLARPAQPRFRDRGSGNRIPTLGPALNPIPRPRSRIRDQHSVSPGHRPRSLITDAALSPRPQPRSASRPRRLRPNQCGTQAPPPTQPTPTLRSPPTPPWRAGCPRGGKKSRRARLDSARPGATQNRGHAHLAPSGAHAAAWSTRSSRSRPAGRSRRGWSGPRGGCSSPSPAALAARARPPPPPPPPSPSAPQTPPAIRMGAAAPACSLGKPHVASLRTGSVRVLRPPPRPPRLCACASGLKASGPFSGVFEGATCRSVSVASGLRLLVSAPMPRAPSQRAVCSACVSGPPGLEGVAIPPSLPASETEAYPCIHTPEH